MSRAEHTDLLKHGHNDTSKQRCVLIYNPISGHGHLDSWNALFIAFLLEGGWRVISLSPAADDLRARLIQKSLDNHPNLHIADWGNPQRTLLERIRARTKRIVKSLEQKWSSLGTQHALTIEPADPLRQTSKNDPEAGYLLPTEFAQRVRTAVRKAPWRPRIVFNMYMDLYRTDVASWQLFNAVHGLPWAGIRFVPSLIDSKVMHRQPSQSIAKEAYYELETLRGMCFLDESLCANYEQHLPSKIFGYLPDITETALPEHANALVDSLKRRANGRTIVFMGGTIGSNKNLARWSQLIELANPAKWFFVQIGEVHENNLTPEDAIAYKKMQTMPPENFLMKAEYLTDERTFNEIIRASDIVFAVYRNFTISSNMPGKAAAFNKPILVANGYLMGRRVEQYQIGSSVAEDRPEEMLEQLTKLVQCPPAGEAFAAYRYAFSHQALCEQFFNFLHKASA